MWKRRILWGVCVIATMAAIFGFSSQTYDQTMKTSDVIVKPIENTVKKDSSEFESEKEEQDYIKKLEGKIDVAVRKSAHMIIFGVLALFVYMLCKSFGMSDADAIIMTLVICAVYAGSDELHQKFVDKRNSQFTDVCVDEFGAVVGVVIVSIVKKIKCRIKTDLKK